MAGLTPEEINKLVRETTKKTNGGNAAVTAGDIKNILNILEQFTKSFKVWTDDLAIEFVKETREVLGLDKKVSLLDELEKNLKKEKKKDKEETAEMMIEFYNKIVDSFTATLSEYGKKLYEDTLQPLAKSIVNNFAKVRDYLVLGFENVKGFFKDNLVKFGTTFRKILNADFRGIIADAFSVVKTAIINVLSLPIKLLKGIFSTLVSVASTLFSIAQFAFTFIYNTLSFIANAAMRISGFLLKVVLKVAYKILSTVASVALNVIGFVTRSVLAPLLFIAGTVALILFAVWVVYGGLKKFFSGDSTGVFGSIGKFFGWVIDGVTDFFKNTFKVGGKFFDFLNDWWVNIWDGELVSFDNPVGDRAGGLKDALLSLLGGLPEWWYGKGNSTFGAGGVSKQLVNWFLGEDGKSGFLGSIKDFLFGAGSASKGFFDLLGEFISDNEWYKTIVSGISEIKGVIDAISKSDWFKDTIAKGRVIAGIATDDTLNAGEKLIGSAAIAFSASGSPFGQMVQEAGQTTGPMRVGFTELNEYARHLSSLMSAKYLQMILSGDPAAKNVDGFIKNNFDIDSLSRYLPARIVSGLKSNGQEAMFDQAFDDPKKRIKLLYKFAFGDYKGDIGRNGLQQGVDDIMKTSNLISPDFIKKKGNPSSLMAIENDYQMIKDGISKLSQNVKMFAKGGIVTGPTNAIIGEAKTPEMVIPLNESGIKFVHEAIEGMNSPSFSTENAEKKIDSVESKLDTVIALIKNQPAPVQQSAPVMALPNNDATIAEMVSRGVFEYAK